VTLSSKNSDSVASHPIHIVLYWLNHTIIKQLGQAERALTAGINMSCLVRVQVSGWWLEFGLEVRG
jgi:hypothetical protein